MPTVLLHGGLGNQLFQYAVGRALSVRTNSDLKLDFSRLPREYDTPTTPRRLQLHKFHTRGEYVHDPIDDHPFLKVRLKLFSYLRPISAAFAARLCRVQRDRTPQTFSPEVLEMPGNSVLYGYYQSERYFEQIRKTIRADITLRESLTGPNRAWKERINSSTSVAVHVRRGDYAKRGWQLPPAYYRAAIDKMQSSHGQVSLFFFSDDLPWVRDHIGALLPSSGPSPHVYYVDNNDGATVPNDLALMSHCRHNVIANSTLSWWGGWLNDNTQKTVLAPAYWIREPVDELDILPARWTPIDW